MLKKVSKNDGIIQEIGRFRAKREFDFDNLIGKIALLIKNSPFDFRVYDGMNNKLTILMRIYEPGEEDLDET